MPQSKTSPRSAASYAPLFTPFVAVFRHSTRLKPWDSCFDGACHHRWSYRPSTSVSTLRVPRGEPAQPHTPDLGYLHAMTYHRDPLRDTKARLVALLALEARIPCSALKEVDERSPEGGERLLQRLRVHLAQPGRFGLVLERRQSGRQHAGGQCLDRLFVVAPHLSKRPVPDPAPRPGDPPQRALLVRSGLQTKAKGAVHAG